MISGLRCGVNYIFALTTNICCINSKKMEYLNLSPCIFESSCPKFYLYGFLPTYFILGTLQVPNLIIILSCFFSPTAYPTIPLFPNTIYLSPIRTFYNSIFSKISRHFYRPPHYVNNLYYLPFNCFQNLQYNFQTTPTLRKHHLQAYLSLCALCMPPFTNPPISPI